MTKFVIKFFVIIFICSRWTSNCYTLKYRISITEKEYRKLINVHTIDWSFFLNRIFILIDYIFRWLVALLYTIYIYININFLITHFAFELFKRKGYYCVTKVQKEGKGLDIFYYTRIICNRKNTIVIKISLEI